MHRPFRCPMMITAAVVGGATLAAVLAYYYWSRPKNGAHSKPATASESSASETSKTSPGAPIPTFAHEERAGAGMEFGAVEGGAEEDVMFNFEDANVRRVCEKLFLEQMDLGESLMEDVETREQGAMHLANAIVLTGETPQLLKVLRGSMMPESYACIQKYLPTAELRVNQLLQDELSIEVIEQYFE